MQRVEIKKGKVVYLELSPEEEAAHLAEMEVNQPTAEEIAAVAETQQAPITARQWFTDNPNAKLIWSMTVTDLATEIAVLVDALFPSATAGNRVKLKLLLTGITLAVRVLVKRDRLLG